VLPVITFGELFAGVGGFSLGFERAGWSCRFQVEWDAHCQQVLAHHWPEVPRFGDVCDVNGAELPPVDVLSFGSPCQDLSVAGKRAGLEGGRSGMFYEATRIIKEMRHATGNQYPRVAVWENVPGAFTSNAGRDFGAVLDEMVDCGALVCEWAVLDAQNFGVPQRRRRIFLVAIFDSGIAGECPDPLLPVREGSPRDFAKSRKAGQEVTGGVAPSLRSGGSGNYPSERGDGSDNLMVIDRAAFNQGENAQYQPHIGPSELSPSLVAQGPHAIGAYRMQAFGQYENDGTSSALKQRDHKDATDLIVQPVGFSHTQGLDAQPSTEAFPSLQREGSGHAVAFYESGPGFVGQTDVAGAMRAEEENRPSRPTHTIMQPVAYDEYNDQLGGDTHHSLRAGPRQSTGVMQNMVVRRLTPLECERLMGWPDNHTLHRADGKTTSDTNRYKMCGNGVASPCAHWVAQQLTPLMENE
jgi:DNA-cytosine methyltransferase